MNLSRNGRKRLIGGMVWMGLGMTVLAVPVAQTIPFSNQFDYAAGTTVQSLTNDGWDASSSAVVVQTNVVNGDAKAVLVPKNTTLTNWVAPAAMSNVWTDFYVQMEPHNDTAAATATSNAVIQLNLDQLGYMQVYDRQNGWLTLSNTVRGAQVTAFTNGQWGRVTVFQNYAEQQCAVYVDGALLKERLPFVSNVAACSSCRLEGGTAGSSYFDNFSMTRAIPAGLADAQEIDDYGYLAFTLNVGPGQTYTTLQSALNAALARYTINVEGGSYNENVTFSQSLAGLTGGVVSIVGSVAVASGASVNSSIGLTVGDLSLSNGSALVVTGSLVASNVFSGQGSSLTVTGSLEGLDMTLGTNSVTMLGQNLGASNIILGAGGSLAVTGTVSALDVILEDGASLYAGSDMVCQSLVENGASTGQVVGTLGSSGVLDLGTISLLVIGGAVSAGDLVLAAGSRLLAAGDLTVTGAVSVATSATLTVMGSLSGHDVAVNGGLVLGQGNGLTATNLTLGSDVVLHLTNGNVAVGSLAINAGAKLVVVNGVVVAGEKTFTGTFTLDENWENPLSPATLPYEEDFDGYQPGLEVNALGFHGWSASDSSVIVKTGQYYSASNGVEFGFFKSLTNEVSAAGASQVWTDFRAILNYNANDVETDVRSSAALMMVVTTNGYLSFYNRLSSSWDVCSQDVWQVSVPKRQAGEWSRVSVLSDYTTKQCAIFLDGVLLRQGFPFINPSLTTYTKYSLANEEVASGYLDNSYVGTTYPSTLTNDVNGNGVKDAQEVLQTDDIRRTGSVFKMR